MPEMRIFDQTIGVLRKSLDLRQQNQQLIATNIANAETPGFAPGRLEFEQDLQQALKRPAAGPAPTNPKHFAIGSGGVAQVQGRLIKTPDRSGLGDGNGVSVDQEMLDLAENQLLYEASAQVVKRKLSLLKYAANDGR